MCMSVYLQMFYLYNLSCIISGAAFFATDASHYLRISKQSLGSLDLVVNIERVTIQFSISIMVSVALWIRRND
jgi:hypothetical protein